MSNIIKRELDENALVQVLKNSIYPGAQDESVYLVLDYCKAAGLDPMLKPVHIVPMWDGKSGQMRDVVMPGVGLYRTQASRTGQFAGMTEPEFGPDKTENIGGVTITYPEWARVTVKRALENGIVAEFTAREYWIENYAVKGGKEKSIAPNSMWAKRPRGQLAKCAAAQALRIAFPELGAQNTAEELEGKTLGIDDVPPPQIDPELISGATEAAARGVEAYAAWWKAAGKEKRQALAHMHASLKEAAEAADKARTVDADAAMQPEDA